MILIILGLLTTLFGVAVGCTVLELTVRALGNSLPVNPTRPSGGPRAGSRLQPDA